MDREQYFSNNLLNWFQTYQRDLPWRRTKNPYHIWVSEIMLQQTRVDTVIPYFYRFIEQFPTIDALAEAPEEHVLKAWEGLGYYSRARNLQTAVREVKERYGGVVPSNKAEISTLRGVGPYTAGAILSIAYNQPEPAVDGNVMRVLSRYFLIEEDIMKGSTRVLMEKLIPGLIPEGAASDFNQALMELGALVCTPKAPYCLTCPVMEHCAGRLAGMEESLPIKKKSKPPRLENRIVALIEGSGLNEGKVLIRQRPQEGLLARMWELPHYTGRQDEIAYGQNKAMVKDIPTDEENIYFLRNQLAEGYDIQYGIQALPGEWFMNTEHTFSHIRWNMKVYRFKEDSSSASDVSATKQYKWIALDKMDKYPFPNVFLRILKAYAESAWVLVEYTKNG